MSKTALVVVGSINTDLVVTTVNSPKPGETVLGSSFSTFQGGKGANQAAAAAQLGCPVAMIGKVGSDRYGAASIDELNRRGVDTTHVASQDGDSGIAVITVTADGNNSIVIVPGANASVSAEFLMTKRDVIWGAGMVLCQLEIPVDACIFLAHMCADAAVPFMLDPAPALTLPPELFPLCTWFTPNATEASFYLGEPISEDEEGLARAAHAFRHMGVENVVLKLGDKGAYAATPNLNVLVPAFPALVADTTAAGDTFNAALATSLLHGGDVLESVRFACAAAAFSVTRRGAQGSMPDYQEVLAVMGSRSIADAHR